jgi:3-methyladenine DNA glycosylase AlkD
MKLKVSAKDKEKYSEEDTKINNIVTEIVNYDIVKARDSIVDFLKTTKFRTKFDEPEKDITKYIALKILDQESLITIDTFRQFIDKLWENEDCSVREIGSFIMGIIYPRDPENLFEYIVEKSKLSNTWNDIDNWTGYSLEEHVAKEFDYYHEKLKPYITHEDQWVRRLVIVLLGRAFFITKNKDYAAKCFETIEASFPDNRKIVLDANSWIIGTLGFRVYPEEVVRYFEKYQTSTDYTIIKLFCDVVRRSKLVKEFDDNLKKQIKSSLQIWMNIEDNKTKKTVESALKFIES